jgi:hypothetical protein
MYTVRITHVEFGYSKASAVHPDSARIQFVEIA